MARDHRDIDRQPSRQIAHRGPGRAGGQVQHQLHAVGFAQRSEQGGRQQRFECAAGGRSAGWGRDGAAEGRRASPGQPFTAGRSCTGDQADTGGQARHDRRTGLARYVPSRGAASASRRGDLGPWNMFAHLHKYTTIWPQGKRAHPCGNDPCGLPPHGAPPEVRVAGSPFENSTCC